MDQAWVRPTVLLCTYGLFLYVKPSEPFLTPYLMGPVHNLTEEQVVSEIYPVWTYAYLALLLPIFLLTDFLKYKPIIILQGLGHIGCWLLLLLGRGVPLMQLMQVFYAIATAGEVGYYSYIYSSIVFMSTRCLPEQSTFERSFTLVKKLWIYDLYTKKTASVLMTPNSAAFWLSMCVVDKSHYQRVTSYVRATTQVGYFLASILSQLLVSLAHLSYFYLNVISLVDVSIAFVISWFLPMPKTTLFFFTSPPQDEDRKEESIGNVSQPLKGTSFNSPPSVRNSLLLLWRDVKQCYLNMTLLRWSIWWALSTCGWLLVVNYVQNLWESIRPSTEYDVYNGAVESVATVLGALGAYGVGYLTVDWSKWGEVTLGVFSLAKCGLLMAMYWTTNIWICYAAYVIFICLYNVVITITQFQLAIGLTTRRFALVFGVNTFAAVALNTTLTVILIDQAGLALDVVTQFIVYSGYFGIVSLVFLSHAVYSFCINCCHAGEHEEVTSTVRSLI